MAAANSLLIDRRSIGLWPQAVPWVATVVAATSNCIENSVLDSLMLVLYIETAQVKLSSIKYSSVIQSLIKSPVSFVDYFRPLGTQT